MILSENTKVGLTIANLTVMVGAIISFIWIVAYYKNSTINFQSGVNSLTVATDGTNSPVALSSNQFLLLFSNGSEWSVVTKSH